MNLSAIEVPDAEQAQGYFKVKQTEESNFPSPQNLFKLLNAAVCVGQLFLFVAAPLYWHESLANMWPSFMFILQKVIKIFLDDGLWDSSNLCVSHLWNTILTIYSALALVVCRSDDTSESEEWIWRTWLNNMNKTSVRNLNREHSNSHDSSLLTFFASES